MYTDADYDILLKEWCEKYAAFMLATAPDEAVDAFYANFLAETMTRPRLLVNSIKCLNCGDILVSSSTHDFNSCICTDVCIDGGLSYNRVVAKDLTMFEDLCVYESKRQIFARVSEIKM